LNFVSLSSSIVIAVSTEWLMRGGCRSDSHPAASSLALRTPSYASCCARMRAFFVSWNA
jgi:hypothetical protein